ncbi:hypothetical protein P9112_007233 [Eukaryota sp. TZLM1-RC]
MSIDPCNSSNEHLINSDVNNPLLAGEKYKIADYARNLFLLLMKIPCQYNFCSFFCLALISTKPTFAFLDYFNVVVQEMTGRFFDRVYWQSKIVFSIYEGILKFNSNTLSSFGKFSESLVINCFDLGEAGFEGCGALIVYLMIFHSLFNK